MMNKTKTRKIGALALVVLGILIFVAGLSWLILFKLSLPPWSIQTEGKYAAFSMAVFAFLWTIPHVISLFLMAYLIHPSKFERFSTISNALFVVLGIGGFVITALLTLAIINNFPSMNYIPRIIFNSITVTSPFWVMGILAIFAFKKDKFENMKKEYKLMILAILLLVIIIGLLYMGFIFII